MLITCPHVGIIDVVKMSRHFAINSGDAKTWNITHIPTGYAVATLLEFSAAVSLVPELESCGVDWDFFQASTLDLAPARSVLARHCLEPGTETKE